jgi:hypothetical protein
MPYQARYFGDSLTALVTEATKQATRAAARQIAQTGQDLMFEEARRATPVRTSHTRDRWLKQEIHERDDRHEARISNDDPVATYLQYGTPPHEIDARAHHAITESQGPRASAHVRGIEPHHMTEKAALVAEVSIGERSVPTLEAWKRECEEAIDLAKKRVR